jgi:hypothetical protein
VKEDFVSPLLTGQEDFELSGTVSKDCIDFSDHKNSGDRIRCQKQNEAL